jgi:hypothetical protein
MLRAVFSCVVFAWRSGVFTTVVGGVSGMASDVFGVASSRRSGVAVGAGLGAWMWAGLLAGVMGW